jgi:RNA polymerase sigma-54 factor
MAISDVEDVRRFMQDHMHPYPMQLVQATGHEVAALMYADLIVRRVSGTSDEGAHFVIDVPAAERYELRISHQFERTLRAVNAGSQMESSQREWLCQAVERARLFIDALHHRWSTLQRIGEYLVSYQSGFFEHGPRDLRPMTQAALASAFGLHESTISRAVSDKFIQLPDGRLIPLSDLFDASLAPKEAIRQILGSTNQRLSDREISNRLRDQGICLARRTVAKYRGQIGLSKRHRSQPLTASTAFSRRR